MKNKILFAVFSVALLGNMENIKCMEPNSTMYSVFKEDIDNLKFCTMFEFDMVYDEVHPPLLPVFCSWGDGIAKALYLRNRLSKGLLAFCSSNDPLREKQYADIPDIVKSIKEELDGKSFKKDKEMTSSEVFEASEDDISYLCVDAALSLPFIEKRKDSEEKKDSDILTSFHETALNILKYLRSYNKLPENIKKRHHNAFSSDMKEGKELRDMLDTIEKAASGIDPIPYY